MKLMFSILLFFAWANIISCGKFPVNFPFDVRKINELARNGVKLNGVLELKENGFLGEGSFGFVFEGKYSENSNNYTKVAIKFVSHFYFKQADDEYEIMTFLKAYKNASVERYGFPAIYYRGQWENFKLIALTKLDIDLFGIADKYKLKPLDILILFRNFVIQSKYMHSHGVRHDDIKPENILISGYKSYLIDFNLCSKIMEDNQGCTWEYRAKRTRTGVIRRPIDDWESFLYSMSRIIGKDWFKPEYDNINHKDTIVYQDEGLKNVIGAFANEVFSGDEEKRFPNYDGFDQMINDEIAKKHKRRSKFPPVFSWLSNAVKQRAKDEFEGNLVPKIGDIDEPSLINFESFHYPVVQNPCEIDNNNIHSNDQNSTKTRKSKMCCFSGTSSQ